MRSFRNLKLRAKFICSFIVVALMAVLLGLASILSLMRMRESDEQMYKENTAPMADLILMYDLLSGQRICANNAALYLESDSDFSASEALDLGNKETEFEAALEHFKTSLKEKEELDAYDEVNALYYGEFKAAKQTLRDAYEKGDYTAMVSAVKVIDALGSDISSAMDIFFNLNVEYADAKVSANQALYKTSVIIVCAIVFVALLIAFVEARFLSIIIVRPMKIILQATKQAGELGDFHFSDEHIAASRHNSQYKDEVGQTLASFSTMMDGIVQKVTILDQIAQGDLSVAVPKVSQSDTMGIALDKMLDNMNQMFASISVASEQVAAGSNQIAIGAQQLAQATTEQSSTVDLLSMNVAGVTEKTKANTELAAKAASLGGAIKENAEHGTEFMKRMTQAVREINEASSSISTVIKVIDDIAFQTNILALNAAVEAARAGEAGKGFAVVADEVRNLAGKSAEAAKNTSALIEDSVQKAELGARIADETSAALEGIVNGINESSAIVARIADESEGQLVAIQEINNGIDQVSEVVQQNSATAEESAAASEEMNSQATMLNNLVSNFKLRGQ